MNETREQFRERIRRVMKDADERYQETHPQPSFATEVKAYCDWYLEWERDAVEAVYAEALRDVTAMFRHQIGDCPIEGDQLREFIGFFAAERGISLEGRDDD